MQMKLSHQVNGIIISTKPSLIIREVVTELLIKSLSVELKP